MADGPKGSEAPPAKWTDSIVEAAGPVKREKHKTGKRGLLGHAYV